MAPLRIYLEKVAAANGYLAGLLLLSALLGLVRFNDIPVGSFFDDAHYLVLAESLASGQGYHLISYPQAPVETAFPPGWPLLLTPLTAVFGPSLFWPRLLAFVFWLGSIPLAYRLFASRVSPALMPLLLALIALNPHLIGMAGTAMSEAAFLFFTLLALALLQTWVRQPDQRTLWRLLAIGLATFTALLVRTIGLALVIAVAISLLRTLRRHQWRWLLPLLGLAVLGLGLLAWFNQKLGGTFVFSQTYSDHLAYLLPRWTEFLRFWEVGTAVSSTALANAVLPIFELQALTNLLTPGVMQGLAWLTLLLVGMGWLIRCRELSGVELYVLGYAAIFYVWVVYIDTVQPRITLPLIPFMTFYLVTAVAQLSRWVAGSLKPQRAPRLAHGVLGLLLVLHLGRNLYAAINPVSQDIVDLAAGTTWMAANLPPDVIVMTPNPVPDYLYLRRQTVDYPASIGQLHEQLTAQSAAYILVRPNLVVGRQASLDAKGQQLLQFIQSSPDQFELVYEDSPKQVWVYQLRGNS